MNAICRVLLTLALPAIFHSHSTAKLIMKPRDTDVQVRQSTYFNCSTDIGTTSIFWFHGTKYVYIGTAILEPYHERFKVDKSEWNGTYIYNLVIHSVQPEDAGEYKCEEDEGAGEKYSVQLAVLAKDPACQSNIRLDEVIGPNVFGILPDEFELTCSVTYHGNILPQMEWKKFGQTDLIRDGVASHVSIDNRVIYTLKLKGDISLDNSSYACQTSRATTNQYKCHTETIKVFYFLGGNEKTQIVVIGDKITCVAHNSTMPCSSQWYHNNYTCPLSCDETITTHNLGIYLCTVKCNVKDYDYYHETLKVFVIEATQPPPLIASEADGRVWLIPLFVVLIIIIVAFTLIVLGLLYFRRKKRKRQAKSDEEIPLAEKNIWDLTVLHQEVFILRDERQNIDVYDSTKYHFKRRMKVDGMMNPYSIASCSVNKCLYIVDRNHRELLHAILRIDPSNGNLNKAWILTGGWSQLSVASDANVIVCPRNGAELYEYTADGELIRTIDLDRNPVDMTQRISAMHAVKLDNGLFVVCQSDPGEVYLISTKSTSSTFGRTDQIEISKKFSEESSDFNDRIIWRQVYLSVGKEGSILVTDRYNNRVVLMNSNLREARILISEEDGIRSPWSTCFNESTGEWIVTDRRRIFVCRVKGESIERHIYDLISH